MDYIQAAIDCIADAQLAGQQPNLAADNGDNPTMRDLYSAAQAHAQLAIAKSLAELVSIMRSQPAATRIYTATSASQVGRVESEYDRRVAQFMGYGKSEYEARIMALPEPKGHNCPACGHSTSLHRMGGCDCLTCECPQPHGRLLPDGFGDQCPDTL